MQETPSTSHGFPSDDGLHGTHAEPPSPPSPTAAAPPPPLPPPPLPLLTLLPQPNAPAITSSTPTTLFIVFRMTAHSARAVPSGKPRRNAIDGPSIARLA